MTISTVKPVTKAHFNQMKSCVTLRSHALVDAVFCLYKPLQAAVSCDRIFAIFDIQKLSKLLVKVAKLSPSSISSLVIQFHVHSFMSQISLFTASFNYSRPGSATGRGFFAPCDNDNVLGSMGCDGIRGW